MTIYILHGIIQGEKLTFKQAKALFKRIDADSSGTISYEEFVSGMFDYVASSDEHRAKAAASTHSTKNLTSVCMYVFG